MMRSSALLRSTSPATHDADGQAFCDQPEEVAGWPVSRWGQIDSATAEMGEVVPELVQVGLPLWLVVRDVEA